MTCSLTIYISYDLFDVIEYRFSFVLIYFSTDQAVLSMPVYKQTTMSSTITAEIKASPLASNRSFPKSDATKRILEAGERKERKSSLQICGLADIKDIKKLERDMSENFRGPRGRRMSVPTLPSQYKPKLAPPTATKIKDTNDVGSDHRTSGVHNPKESTGRAELAHLKKDLRMLRPKSIAQLRLGGRSSSALERHRSEAEDRQDLSLEDQFEALRLCRYLRQPGKELQELDTEEIFNDD